MHALLVRHWHIKMIKSNLFNSMTLTAGISFCIFWPCVNFVDDIFTSNLDHPPDTRAGNEILPTDTSAKKTIHTMFCQISRSNKVWHVSSRYKGVNFIFVWQIPPLCTIFCHISRSKFWHFRSRYQGAKFNFFCHQDLGKTSF